MLLKPIPVVLPPGTVENADLRMWLWAHAAPLPQVVFHLLVGKRDGALERAERGHDLLGAEAARHAVLAGGKEIVVAAGEKPGGVDLVQALDAAFADERNIAVLVVAAEGAAVVLERAAAQRTVVAPGPDQLPELALELAVLLARRHARPSASCQRPTRLWSWIQQGSAVGGTLGREVTTCPPSPRDRRYP